MWNLAQWQRRAYGSKSTRTPKVNASTKKSFMPCPQDPFVFRR